MRFIDASVFLYAFLRPRRALPPEIAKLRECAKRIIYRIERGEKVVTTVIHVSEVANILEARLPIDRAIEYVASILGSESIRVLEVSNRLSRSS